jgi:hypothetical protein
MLTVGGKNCLTDVAKFATVVGVKGGDKVDAIKTMAEMKNPLFGRETPEGTIVNERCRCGGLRTEHDGLIGHGPCTAKRCRKFTWASFVIAEAR